MPSNNQSWALIGHLPRDCPGVFRDLKRAYDERALGYLCGCYAESARWGGLRETPVVREEGVSHTPRPARIVKLLLKETPGVSVLTVAAALFVSVRPEFIEYIDPTFTPALQGARRLRSEEELEPELYCILLARMLDDARHLHMTGLGDADKKQRYQAYSQQIRCWQQQLGETPGCTRLLCMLTHWVSSSAGRFSA